MSQTTFTPPAASRMSPQELRSSMSLAAVIGLRMLGLFMIIPVFTIYARTVPGGENAATVGLAIGIYGFVQALFYIPYGWLSDHLGRKPVIAAGLAIFALGSVIAALAHDMNGLILGRAVQGLGAVSSAVIAFVADLTAEANRTKAMAMVGGFIGISYAIAIVSAAPLFGWIGMKGIFLLIAVLAVAAIAVVFWVVPDPGVKPVHHKAPFRTVLHNPELLRLNFGVFVLHATQIALFVVIPRALVEAGLPVAHHWELYLPVMGLSFVLMVPAIIVAEKHGRMKPVMLAAIALLLVGQVLLATMPHTVWMVATFLLIYFLGFNVLEASQPSLVSKLAPGERKGAAMGVYNTTQSLGYAVGGAGGGWLLAHVNASAVFTGCSVLVLAWLIVAASMARPPQRARAGATGAKR
jgi:predicted MFS family arabinose efflux permease